MQSTSVSPGLAFMQAAFNAMPRTLGDRVRIAALGDALTLAIKCRMVFSRDDIKPLERLQQHTCVGVFRAFDDCYYRQACEAGGTFAGVWEKVKGIKPWSAPEVLARRSADVMKDNRVAPGMGVLIGVAEDDHGHPLVAGTKLELAALQGRQVWWCTSIDADHIVLCRYHRHPDGSCLKTDGLKPTRRLKLNREQWKALLAAGSPSETDLNSQPAAAPAVTQVHA